MKALFVACFSLASATNAWADPSGDDNSSPRSVGRAGVGLVSEDTALALSTNPAAIARRSGIRLALAMGLRTQDTSISDSGAPAPILDRAGASSNPSAGVAFGLGERWLIAISVQHHGASRRYPAPQFGQPAADVEELLPARYAGHTLDATTQRLTAGAAVRTNDWLAIGLAASIDSISVETQRSVWAGFSGRETIGDPSKDLLLSLRSSKLAPRATVGVLAAPIDVPLEFAASASLRLPTTLSGEATAEATTNVGAPPVVTRAPVAAELPLAGVANASAGIRYLGNRFVVEVGGHATLHWRTQAARRWRLTGLEVRDESGAVGTLEQVSSRLAVRDHFRVGASVDVAIIDGFLWLTSGYSFTSARVADRDRNPLHPSAAVQTIAIGAEVVWSGLGVSVGVSRGFSGDRSVGSRSSVAIVNPFGPDAGSALTGTGSYGSSVTRAALSIEHGF